MISAISLNNPVKVSNKVQSAKPYASNVSFCGAACCDTAFASEIKPKSNAEIAKERALRLSKFLTQEAMTKYKLEQDFVREIKEDINAKVKHGIKKPYNKQMDGGYTVIADYVVNDDDVQIYRIERRRKNGIYDVIRLNQKGEITKILNGVRELDKGYTIINEEMSFENGLIKNLKMETTERKTTSYTLTEIIYSNGKIKEVRENINKNIFGMKLIGKKEVFNT